MGKLKKSLKERKEANKIKLESIRKDLASFCQIGGQFSDLELVILVCGKLDRVVRGDIHPTGQLKFLHKMMKEFDKPTKNRCRTMKDFYSSRAWKLLRYQAFEKYGNYCQCCGATVADGITLHVDHIKPRSLHPELALDLNNLQILCEDCNVGKLNQWDTDWRP